MANSKNPQYELEKLVLHLYEIGVVQFGSFVLKSGIESPVYFDLRLLISYPTFLKAIADLIWNVCPKKKWDLICGVPYTALPIATMISAEQNLPMLIRRKEVKSYGTKKVIEGVYKSGQFCLIIEDVIVSGASILETVKLLRSEGLIITDAVVLLDRSQGGESNLIAEDINITSVIKVKDLLQILHNHKKIDDVCLENCTTFLQLNSAVPIPGTKSLSLMQRSVTASHPVVRKIMNTVIKKKSNLCIAIDVNTSFELLKLAEMVAPYICILKTHIDTLNDFSEETTSKLKELSLKHDFLLFEDRKFCDIGNTVLTQFRDGLYKISSWADIITLHAIPGPGVIKGLSSGLANKETGFLIVAEMSSEGNLCSSDYQERCVKMANDNPENIIGFVAQSNLSQNANLLVFTPGISLQSSGDNLGQQYVSVEDAILHRGTDIIIVGRGITSSDNPVAAAQLYQERGYEALLKR